jgi:predicted amidophosphoribosyltransferase
LVHVPGHLPPGAGGDTALPRALTTLLPWLRPEDGRLVRHTEIRASATSELRPTVAEHLSTLAWSGPAPPRRVIMVDDVFTHGCVTEACAHLLRDAGAREVIVLALARTRF